MNLEGGPFAPAASIAATSSAVKSAVRNARNALARENNVEIWNARTEITDGKIFFEVLSVGTRSIIYQHTFPEDGVETHSRYDDRSFRFDPKENDLRR
jgi:hypothetical protein